LIVHPQIFFSYPVQTYRYKSKSYWQCLLRVSTISVYLSGIPGWFFFRATFMCASQAQRQKSTWHWC
jgi:hypothetical protein